MLLGFGSPIFLVGGFIFGKWLGTFIVVLAYQLEQLYFIFFQIIFLKDLIAQKFSKFSNLNEKFKKNEFLFFLIYRFVGGIPFLLAIFCQLYLMLSKELFFWIDHWDDTTTFCWSIIRSFNKIFGRIIKILQVFLN